MSWILYVDPGTAEICTSMNLGPGALEFGQFDKTKTTTMDCRETFLTAFFCANKKVVGVITGLLDELGMASFVYEREFEKSVSLICVADRAYPDGYKYHY